ncbi:MAG: hypothetical protein GY858_02305 [Candidatus Omnitrophica bacterium]|nr:hypothetical protein [Candidatus Omnitrophota bacterium]
MSNGKADYDLHDYVQGRTQLVGNGFGNLIDFCHVMMQPFGKQSNLFFFKLSKLSQ